MILSEQVLSLLFCFIWGFVYYFLFYKFKRFLVFSKFNLLYNIIFNLTMSIGFFMGIVKINDGILNIYFLIFIILGFVLSRFIFGKFKCQI